MAKVVDQEGRAVDTYLGEIAASAPLTRAQEAALAERIHQGDRRARDELVEANLRFVVEVAKRYQDRGLPMADLISSGNLGLLTAAERYDGSKGCRFITYAVWWIRQAIQLAVADQGHTVRLPASRLSLLREIGEASHRLAQREAAEPGVEQLAGELAVSAAVMAEILRSAGAPRSLDTQLQASEEGMLLDTLVDTRQEPPDAGVQRESTRQELEGLLSVLDERERRVIRLSFGLGGREALSLVQIGTLVGVTRERVRQIRQQALRKLRAAARPPLP
ncbi:MAG: RNA polymerase sigma factor RpoD/SigA [Candidatus Latescibacterota bacterium]